MLGNILGWLVIVALTLLFGWLTFRAGRIRRVLLKWAGICLAGLLTLFLALASVVLGRGLYILYAPRNYPVAGLTVEHTFIVTGAHC